MLCTLQDEEGELQLQRQSLLCRKKVSAFDLSHSGQMCGAGTMDGAPTPQTYDKEQGFLSVWTALYMQLLLRLRWAGICSGLL